MALAGQRADLAERHRPPGGGPAAFATSISSATPDPNAHDLDSDTRSLASVVLATRQPPFTGPTTQSSGTKTSSRNTWLNSESPVISRSGRTSTPGADMSTGST